MMDSSVTLHWRLPLHSVITEDSEAFGVINGQLLHSGLIGDLTLVSALGQSHR